MDPLTALGLAANIYTFAEAGAKAVKQYNELRRSGSDATRNNIQIGKITDELKQFSSKLAANGPPELRNLATECSTTCDELLGLLNKLRVKDLSSKRERVKAILNSSRKTQEISSLEARLDSYRSQLVASFLLILRSEQSELNNGLNKIQHDIKQLSQQRCDQFSRLRLSLLDVMQSYSDKVERGNISLHGSIGSLRDQLGQQLLELKELVAVTSPQVSILKRLRFTYIRDREDGIRDATRNTCLWPIQQTLQDGELTQVPQGSQLDEIRELFISWLQSGTGVFHISGKAGSGKSTLMKRLWLHDQTRKHLEQWAAGRELCYAAFFFWNAGSEEQKSLTGLYRSILFTILNEHPDLISKVFPKFWRKNEVTAPYTFDELIRPPILREAFQLLVKLNQDGKYRMCLLIDGLDEYNAHRHEHWELARQLCDWANNSNGNIKFCVSSRPHMEFQAAFSSSKQIHLHELNSRDIEEYCQEMFLDNENFLGLNSPEETSQTLTREIVDRAEGVFLWVVLVVRIILSEARRHGTEDDLRKKLLELPDDLDELYDKMMGSLSTKDRRLTERILFVLLTNPFEDPVNALCLKWLVDEDAWERRFSGGDSYSKSEHEAHINYVIYHLDVWTQGLVECINVPPKMESRRRTNSQFLWTRVKLFHKTVKDYFMEPERFYKLRSACKGLGLGELHARLRLAEVKAAKLNCRKADALCIYGYEILSMRFDAEVISREDQQGSFQITWSLIKELANILPSSSYVVFPQAYLLKKFTSGHSESICGSGHTSFPHFAASLGLDSAIITAELNDSRINVQSESEIGQKNVLLSACLSSMWSKSTPILERVASQNLVTSLLQNGFSAHDKIRLFFRRGISGVSRSKDVTLWAAFVALLSYIAVTPLIRYSAEMIGVLGALLHNETQEEVLLLPTDSPDKTHTYFIGLEDFLRSSEFEVHAQIFDDLHRHAWPEYESGDVTSPNSPAWVWNWNNRGNRPIGKVLSKLTKYERRSSIQIGAVVSRNAYIETASFSFITGYRLWHWQSHM
ncbi:hypothetical protein F4775DRAFT_401639 [Biscogniauxia sp. FL1348]|nr:hypothetical protein F4775DRAFT_401639 [Biscogniauxia sp. FL1348]